MNESLNGKVSVVLAIVEDNVDNSGDNVDNRVIVTPDPEERSGHLVVWESPYTRRQFDMVTMQCGFKSKLEAGGVDAGQPLQVWTSVVGNSQYDIVCFALNEHNLVPDNRYVVFFNQADSPNGEISLIDDSPNGTTFQVNLVSLPSQIKKLCFTVAINGPGLMRDIKSGAVRLMQHGEIAFTLDITGSQFQNQTVIITIEIYTKDCWRVAAVANGFNFSGGLNELMTHYGVSDGGKEPGPSPRPEKQSGVPAGSSVRKPLPAAANKNAEGFDRSDDDWV